MELRVDSVYAQHMRNRPGCHHGDHQPPDQDPGPENESKEILKKLNVMEEYDVEYAMHDQMKNMQQRRRSS